MKLKKRKNSLMWRIYDDQVYKQLNIWWIALNNKFDECGNKRFPWTLGGPLECFIVERIDDEVS